jgi:DNA-directed RNA polymerase subunit RPC12/RpoP
MSAPTHCPYCNAQLSTRRLTRESKAQCARCGTVFQADTGRILSPPADAASTNALIGVCPNCGKDFALKAIVPNPKVRCGKCGMAFLARDHATPRTAMPRPPTPEDDGARPFVLDTLPSPDATDSGTIEAIIESEGPQPPGIVPVEEPHPGGMLKESLVTFTILGALACIGVLLWLIFGGPSEPLLGGYAAFVPEDATVVACFDLERIRGSSLYGRFKDQAEAATRQLV